MYALIPSKILGMDVSLLFVVVICALFAYGTGKIAAQKGYSYPTFALIGFLFPLIGLIIALVMPPKSAPSSADEIAKYKRLLDDGAITQAEYDKKKREILG